MTNRIGILIFCAMCIPAFFTDYDKDKDTDFPKHEEPKVTVFIKQIDGINPLVFKDCAILGQKVEC